jgi:hypothetical protein
MSKTSDWFPGPRTEIIELCRTWIEYLTAARRTAWGCRNPPSMADYGIGVCALHKRHLSGLRRTAWIQRRPCRRKRPVGGLFRLTVLAPRGGGGRSGKNSWNSPGAVKRPVKGRLVTKAAHAWRTVTAAIPDKGRRPLGRRACRSEPKVASNRRFAADSTSIFSGTFPAPRREYGIRYRRPSS